MKKFILAIALVALTGSVMAQKVQKSAREQARIERQTLLAETLKAALVEQNFTFTPFNYSAPFQGLVELNGGMQNYVEVYPTDLAMLIPFSVGTPAPNPVIRMLNMPSVPYTYSAKAIDNSRYIVVIGLQNVSSQNFNTSMALQGINLTLHFDISATTGQATLTITPDFSPSTMYTGIVRANVAN